MSCLDVILVWVISLQGMRDETEGGLQGNKSLLDSPKDEFLDLTPSSSCLAPLVHLPRPDICLDLTSVPSLKLVAS